MDFTVKSLGKRAVPSPLRSAYASHDTSFEDDNERLIYDPLVINNDGSCIKADQSFELAGPR
ncbi:MAG TPA: hypothetical protein PKN50_01830, partial [Spirochaetota bacterium]|nr:hypothetical protein [Spirochaetota bacterium]